MNMQADTGKNAETDRTMDRHQVNKLLEHHIRLQRERGGNRNHQTSQENTQRPVKRKALRKMRELLRQESTHECQEIKRGNANFQDDRSERIRDNRREECVFLT